MTAELIKEARDQFERAVDWEQDNREEAIADLEFSRASNQWPEKMKKQREDEDRPCLTINKTLSFIRQVVNDSRQNKPAIKVHAVDDTADKETAEVLSGLIRNIERSSKSDIAYDTAIDQAVSSGFGYIRVGLDFAFDDIFDMDISIDRVVNQFSVYGDPDSTSADGSDWNTCFVTERHTKEQFEEAWGDKAQIDWEHTSWEGEHNDWRNDEGVLIAEWWTREAVKGKIFLLVGGEDSTVVDDEMILDDDIQALLGAGALQIAQEREITRFKVVQRFITGKEVLEENEWPGKFIPIVPVYGDEFWIGSKRYIRSLINPAKDAQRMHNFWRTNSTELVALAPRVPYIGPKGFADIDPQGWATANTVSHPYLEYKGNQPPSRQPLDSGVAAGSLQEALNASDDMKAIMGLHDASLGARSNETSGRAILARQREGDISTFHFIDNLSRSIRQIGNIVLDLIPHVYDKPRIVRVLGEDGTEEPVQINQPFQQLDDEGNPMLDDREEAILALHDVTKGKYDLTVSSGPSFTTRREEASFQMTEAIRAVPDFGAILIDKLAAAQDWPDAEEIAERAKAMLPKTEENISPEVAALMQQIQVMQQQIEELTDKRQIELAEVSIKAADSETKRFDAQTKRLSARGKIDAEADKQDFERIAAISQTVTNQ